MAIDQHPHEQALVTFLEQRPELREQLDNLNPLEARARGETRRSIAPSACMKPSRPKPNALGCSPGN
ncbi:hypothetical protein PBOI14_50280 [Pseudomonas sp. Boi14]|nr:hypothetical protein PBOI14_50280 [Pseudomonas sp. Boi14]